MSARGIKNDLARSPVKKEAISVFVDADELLGVSRRGLVSAFAPLHFGQTRGQEIQRIRFGSCTSNYAGIVRDSAIPELVNEMDFVFRDGLLLT